jgi:hypothetical protein
VAVHAFEDDGRPAVVDDEIVHADDGWMRHPRVAECFVREPLRVSHPEEPLQHDVTREAERPVCKREDDLCISLDAEALDDLVAVSALRLLLKT